MGRPTGWPSSFIHMLAFSGTTLHTLLRLLYMPTNAFQGVVMAKKTNHSSATTQTLVALACELIEEHRLADIHGANLSPQLMYRLAQQGLVRKYHGEKGDYVLRYKSHGNPVLLDGGEEICFRSLEFVRACRVCCADRSPGTDRPENYQILQIVE